MKNEDLHSLFRAFSVCQYSIDAVEGRKGPDNIMQMFNWSDTS